MASQKFNTNTARALVESDRAISVDTAVFTRGGAAYTNSRAVALVFGKRHADVLRAVDGLECSTKFRKRNFALTVERAKVGATTRMVRSFNMTKDGFVFLVMGFNGREAAALKEAYIERFNAMERALKDDKQVPVKAHTRRKPQAKALDTRAIALPEVGGNFMVRLVPGEEPIIREVAAGAVAVDGSNANSLRTFLHRFVPAEHMPILAEIATERCEGPYRERVSEARARMDPRHRHLVWFDSRGAMHVQEVGAGATVVDGGYEMSLCTFLRECVPAENLPVALDLLMSRMKAMAMRGIKNTGRPLAVAGPAAA